MQLINVSQKTIIKHYKPEKPLSIDYHANGNYFDIKISPNKIYKVNYPVKYLSKLTQSQKEILLKNFVYCKTSPLKISRKEIHYKFGEPKLKNFIDSSIQGDIPRIAHMSNVDSNSLEERFRINVCDFTENKSADILNFKKTSFKNKFLISLSFGKDSLLSYALLKDLGVKIKLVSFNIGLLNEKKVKNSIIKNFLKKERQSLSLVYDSTDKLLSDKKPERKLSYLDYTNGLLSFALELIPIAANSKSKYVVFGNQKDFDGYYIDNKTNRRVYYSYDQTTRYMNMENNALKPFTNNNIQVTSLIKPIYTLAIYKLFASRYRRLTPFIMSCEDSVDKQWCEKCETCAQAYLFMSAFTDPQILGFSQSTFSKSYAKKYLLFTKKKMLFQNVYPPSLREQELLAFLLAERNGQTGYLIDLFKKKYKKDALAKEAELRKKFFTVYKSELIPTALRKPLYKLLSSEIYPSL